MREIKFKAFYEELNKIGEVYGFDIFYVYVNFDKNTDEDAMYKLKRTDVVLLQYTGLKDKNGVEIYEGDITRVGNYVYIVEIDLLKGLFFRCIENLSLVGVNVYYTSFIKNVEFEVMGNIYENPELLKQQ